MKKDMTAYVRSMCGVENLDALYDLVCTKYKKFIHFYRLVEDYSDEIEDIDYTFESKHSLDACIYFTKNTNVDNIRDEIESRVDRDLYDYNIVVSGNKISIIIKTL